MEGEYAIWKSRPLASRYEYIFADGTYIFAFADGPYITFIYEGEGCKMPILLVIGIKPDGVREVLGFSVGDGENQVAWEGWVVRGHQAQRGKHRGVSTEG